MNEFFHCHALCRDVGLVYRHLYRQEGQALGEVWIDLFNISVGPVALLEKYSLAVRKILNRLVRNRW